MKALRLCRSIDLTEYLSVEVGGDCAEAIVPQSINAIRNAVYESIRE